MMEPSELQVGDIVQCGESACVVDCIVKPHPMGVQMLGLGGLDIATSFPNNAWYDLAARPQIPFYYR